MCPACGPGPAFLRGAKSRWAFIWLLYLAREIAERRNEWNRRSSRQSDDREKAIIRVTGLMGNASGEGLQVFPVFFIPGSR